MVKIINAELAELITIAGDESGTMNIF